MANIRLFRSGRNRAPNATKLAAIGGGGTNVSAPLGDAE